MKIALHWKILIGILLGVLLGIMAIQVDFGLEFVQKWVKPIGQIYIKLLKLIAVPLIFISLTKGISDMKDIVALSNMGYRTLAWYLATTVFAVLLGLFLVNSFDPGSMVSQDTIAQLSENGTLDFGEKIKIPEPNEHSGPLDFFVQIVPNNIFEALTQNGSLLQVIFFTLFFSICLLLVKEEHQEPIRALFNSLNEVMMKMVDVIIAFSPYAVVALMATLVVETADPQIFKALVSYALVLLLGMAILLFLYPFIVKMITGMSAKRFVQGILPAQLVALTTSSSMATLPVTMDCLQENLEIDQEVVSFVCPVGATINMDATSLMQAIAAVFVCQVLGHDIGFNDQLTIVLTATLASIGAAAAPSAGIVMLVIVLESVGFPSESLPIALAMILAVDRPLDMCRTVVNISGDSCVSVLVAHSLKKKVHTTQSKDIQ